MVNPYAVWNTPPAHRNGSSKSQDPSPSIYGALPSPNTYNYYAKGHQAQSLESTPTSFHAPLFTSTFTSLNPSIVNCMVTGPNGVPVYQVLTDPVGMAGYTVLQSADGTSRSALIEWRSPAKVEICDVVPKQKVFDFLRVSRDRRYRIMVVGAQEFMWLPDHNGTVKFYTVGAPGASEFLGQLTSRSAEDTMGGVISLAMTESAVRQGLLQACIVTAVLLYSGRNLE